jgi:hypothetical protein
MIAELTDLDRAVIEALSARYERGGEAAFDEAVSRLVIALCGLLEDTCGTPPARSTRLSRSGKRRQRQASQAALVAAE